METPLRYQVTVGFREALLRQCRYPGLLSSSWLSLGISTHLGTAGHRGKGLCRATHRPSGQHQGIPDRQCEATQGVLQPSHEMCLSSSEVMHIPIQLIPAQLIPTAPPLAPLSPPSPSQKAAYSPQ